MRQLIIVRKDLNMSVGKTAVQCCHASQAWLMDKIKNKAEVMADSLFSRHQSYEFVENPEPYIPYLPYIYCPELNSSKPYKIPIAYMRRDLAKWAIQAFEKGDKYFWTKHSADNPHELELVLQDEITYYYDIGFTLDVDTMDKWINDIYTKTICSAKNKTQLMKAVTMAQELGLEENKDFFLICDRCLTELVPEEQDENGGKTLTCIGFRPLDDDVVHKISKKYQLL